MDEFITGFGQGQRGFGFSHADHVHLLLTQTHGKLGKITVAGHQAEAVHLAGIQDVHGVNDHGHIRGIFSYCIVELLDGVDGVFQKSVLLPAVSFRPVSVNTAVGRITVIRNFVKYARRIFFTDIVRIYEYRKMLLFFLFYIHSPSVCLAVFVFLTSIAQLFGKVTGGRRVDSIKNNK